MNKSYSTLFQAISAGATILTPNRRLSSTIHKIYQEDQLRQQKSSWQTPTILPITTWIELLWKQHNMQALTSLPILLNKTQEHFLWEKTISSATINEPLLQLSETAETANGAWRLLKQWELELDDPNFANAEDYRAFQTWALQFVDVCRQHEWIDLASLPDKIPAELKINEFSHDIILIGFTDLAPQFESFFNRLQDVGRNITRINLSYHQAQSQRISLRDQEQEILSMARWAKMLIIHEPSLHIGCVIPTLDQIRDRVLQLFSEVFAAENTYSIEPQLAPFNLSAGKYLSRYPIIHTALLLLSLQKNLEAISIENMSHLLATPFLGEAERERLKRASLDNLLRKANLHRINLALYTNLDETNTLSLNNHCPHLAKRLQRFLAQQKEPLSLHSYSHWAKYFSDSLALLGWPGERSLNSEEYQVVMSWLKVLDEFTTLDHVSSAVSHREALETLQKMVARTLFQGQSPEAPIQILGMLEAASLPFDYLWVAGMDDLSWPPSPKPHPFIPKSLQREKQMPHATAERERLFCQTLIQQFKQSAAHLIFSHAEKKEECELQATPLILDIPEITLDELSLPYYQRPYQRIYAAKQLEEINDEIAPPCVNLDKIRGGVNIIKQQALCPFKAFAQWRLHAHELEMPLLGLRPKDRGNLLHAALEKIWNQLGNQTHLQSIEESELQALIMEAIQSAFTILPHAYHDAAQYLLLEKKRLQILINDWLQIEKNRPSFKVITQEVATSITLNQLTLSIRIDRIDELEDGKKLIIDYKTGKNNNIYTWFDERPEEPQLPLYSLLNSDEIMGITFAELCVGNQGFKGISRYAINIQGIKLISEIKKATATSWNEQLVQWKTTLTQLSDDFYSGFAKVNPKNPSTTCMICALQPLCRVSEHDF